MITQVIKECLTKTRPCPFCGGTIIRADGGLKPNPGGGMSFVGRFFCFLCGASTREIALGTNNPDKALCSSGWSAVLNAWNLRAPTSNRTPNGGNRT